jgi:hypothetical protein
LDEIVAEFRYSQIRYGRNRPCIKCSQ